MIDETLAAVRHQVRLRGTPAAQRGRPLLRPAQVEELPAGVDHGAVDDPGDDRRHFVGRNGDHHFVQEGHALFTPAKVNEGPTPSQPRQREQVSVPEAVADRRGLAEDGVGGLGIALLQALQRDRHQQIALFHTVQLAFREDTPRAGKPAARLGHLSPGHKLHADPERAARGPRGIAEPQAFLIRPRPDLEAFGVPASEIRGRCQALEIVEPQRQVAISG
jgi:hypothetical protein